LISANARRVLSFATYLPLLAYGWIIVEMLGGKTPSGITLAGAISCLALMAFGGYVAQRGLLADRVLETLFVVGVANPALFDRFVLAVQKWRPEDIKDTFLSKYEVAFPGAPLLLAIVLIAVVTLLVMRMQKSRQRTGMDT